MVKLDRRERERPSDHGDELLAVHVDP